MSLPVSPKNISAYTELLGLVWKYGNRQVLESIGLSDLPGFRASKDDERPDPKELANDLERLGPTYIKAGQLLSAQLNILPPEYMEAMSRLQDKATPRPFEEMVTVIQEDLEGPWQIEFRKIDPEPIGSASLGQVYQAELKDGTPVAIKVQRPGNQQRVEEDFEALSHLARMLDHLTESRYAFEEICDHTRQMIEQELDYTLEADNLTTMRKLMEDLPSIRIPRPFTELSSKRVLVMDYLPGERLGDVSRQRLRDMESEELATALFKKYLDHILVEGFFHADPHPGNVLVHEDNSLVMLDLGMVGRIPPRLRSRLTQLVLAVIDGRGEDVADCAEQIGVPLDGYNRDRFVAEISELVLLHYNHSIKTTNIGDVVLQIARLCAQHRVKVPPLLSMVGKTLVNLDQLGQSLSPGFNPSQKIQEHANAILTQEFFKAVNPKVYYGEVLEVRRLIQNLPLRVNQILDTVARSDKGIKIDAINEVELIRGVEKIANRITMGLIIAAMFIAGAMVMNVDPTGGIPVLSWVLFSAGTVGVIVVVTGMLVLRGSTHFKKKK